MVGCADPVNAPQEDLGSLIGGKADKPSGGGADLKMAGDLALPGDLAPPPVDLKLPVDMTQPPDLAPPLKEWGIDCAKDSECASGHCLGVLPGADKICVSSCQKQGDCAGLLNAFCEPSWAGDPDGYCIPHHPMHCSSCSKNSDCGILAERCITTGGDTQASCHIDCALAGDNACPKDYLCTSVQDGFTQRKLCVPKNGLDCLSALGGFCDRVATPQSCKRINKAGSCDGQRSCLNSARYDSCSAMAPQFLACGQQNAAGCKQLLDPNATNSLQNCGACGNSCPGQNVSTCEPSCSNKVCGLTCRGEHYDVDKSPSNGCEVVDDNAANPNHNPNTAIFLGSVPCWDDESQTDFNGHLPADFRVHANPIVDNFKGTFGSAPDYFQIYGKGGWFCYNDYSVDFTTSGGGNANCYNLTFQTNNLTDSHTTNGHSSVNLSGGKGSYSDGSVITFIVQRICSTGAENASYSVSFHL